LLIVIRPSNSSDSLPIHPSRNCAGAEFTPRAVNERAAGSARQPRECLFGRYPLHRLLDRHGGHKRIAGEILDLLSNYTITPAARDLNAAGRRPGRLRLKKVPGARGKPCTGANVLLGKR